MLDFRVDVETCISCGQCASECPAMIISMETNVPTIAKGLEQYCIECMHCVAICSERSLSIHGHGPEDGIKLKGVEKVSPEDVELLIKARRTTRNYQDRNVPAELQEKLVTVASHAPSGHNDRGLLYTLIDDKGVLFDFRDEVYDGLNKMVAAKTLPEGLTMFADIEAAWRENKKDILFRNAPHLLIVTSDKESAAPLHDAVISLATFELYASSHGLGTVWNGLVTLMVEEIMPYLKERLGIPKDHIMGYAMGFGYPAVWYKTTVDRGVPEINRVK